MVKSVEFCPEFYAVKLDPVRFPNTAMLSITTPNMTAPLKEGWEHLLRVAFDDCETVLPILDVKTGVSTDSVPFSEEMAESIIRFLKKLPTTVDHLIIHCHAGISRSASVS